MVDLGYLKQFCTIKDVADIIGEIEKLDCLVWQNNWEAVERHLYDISQKHKNEREVYNSVNRIPPQSTQQSATNCRQFLLALGEAKIIEKSLKHLGGT